MSNSRFQNSGKSEFGSTIGFRFHANDEELEELQSDHKTSDEKISEINQETKTKPVLLTSESLDHSKADECKSELIGDVVRDQWNLLGRRSTSIDSNYESPFSNPIETWKKLNILKEKITKTVEEKISEMKIDRNVLSKSGKNRLLHSKENSSVSDSEDTSESSKLSELWKDAEDLSSSPTKVSNESSNIESILENAEPEAAEIDGNELRNRRGHGSVSELFRLPDIKIATAKSELKVNATRESFEEDVESGVEADENLYPSESDSVDFLDDSLRSSGNSQRPPSGGRYIFKVLGLIGSILFSTTYTAVILLGLTLYYYFPLPDFAKGFLCCFLLMIFWEAVKNFLYSDEISSVTNQCSKLDIPNYKSLPPLKVPEYKPVQGVWINEYNNELYDPDYYSVTQTLPAYLELEGSILKLSRPKHKIHKRATFDEPNYKLHFISERKYDISQCNVFLMPDGLTRKRLFSKKYPIVIFLRPDSLISEKKGKHANEKEANEESETFEKFKNKSSLYLFARCDRQKEEWYRKLLAASWYRSESSEKNENVAEAADSAPKSDDSPAKEPTTPLENILCDENTAQLDEYYQYMVKFVDLEVIYEEVTKQNNYKKQKKKKDSHSVEDKLEPQTTSKLPTERTLGKSRTAENQIKDKDNIEIKESSLPELQLQWFNAFVNRILFDVFRSPFWLSKIHDKVQRKLNSIRLPYYIEDIEVIEMDLGKTGPVFHRVSQPYLDERGLWFDMDTTFDGFIILTIQTHLNLVKLQKGFEDKETSNPNEKPEKEKKKPNEVKEPPLTKESGKEVPKEKFHQKVRKLSRLCSASCSIKLKSKEPSQSEEADGHTDVEAVSNLENDHLIDEVAQLAEMAVEESLKVESQKDLKTGSKCPCTWKSRSPIYDSDLEDSAESSDEDDEEEEEVPPEPHSNPNQEQQPVSQARRYPKNRRSSKRLFRVFENVAQSKYFKSMAQSKYIQKAIAGVSAAKLRLTLEIKSLTGILTINIPPPPSDRFWYGFREMPKLVFSANPKIGQKAVKFVHIRNYLQKKILYELKKVMVLPNMIDFVLPTSSPAGSSNSTQLDLQESQDQEETPTEI